ncbi:YybH family protein [Arthrobacter globiformis]|uniref:YybH family protein n=1 Tax=Arthrobacter globiformis TaxID=1665 RepID=UPI002793A2C2|nr:nuclear transport factor 2 family protein [Arthrobacter globiformis]MDQ0617411.1 ketosteroid isomerase-like protein [Arthrobacter globiformis]
MVDSDFDGVVERLRAALAEILKGDPAPCQALFAKNDEVTLANPFGGVSRGRDNVAASIAKAAAIYRDGEVVSMENQATAVVGDLAYVVLIERFRVRVAGRADLDDVALRTTNIYRREGNEWLLVHRQADPRVDAQAPESVVQ